MTSALWGSIKAIAEKVGEKAAAAGHKTVVHAELLYIDNQLKARRQKFGVELYDYVLTWSKTQEFFSSDDLLTATLRPPFLKAQREIAALSNKRTKQRQTLETAKAQRAAVGFGNTWQEKVISTAKTTAMVGGEAKLHTELTLMENEILYYKQAFGQELYDELERLEDQKGWLPTDREIRSLYDACRKDIDSILKRRKEKELELQGRGEATGEEDPYPFKQSTAQPYAATVPEQVYGSSSDMARVTIDTPSFSTAGYAAPAATSCGVPAAASSGCAAPTNDFIVPTPASYSASTSSAYSAPAATTSWASPPSDVGYSAPKPVVNTNWMNQADPFAPAATTATAIPPFQQPAQQVTYDPFANNAPPPQQQALFDPFASATPPNSQQKPFGSNPPPSSMYDPFAGL